MYTYVKEKGCGIFLTHLHALFGHAKRAHDLVKSDLDFLGNGARKTSASACIRPFKVVGENEFRINRLLLARDKVDH